MDDDDLDLAAWAAPPAPPGLADRVIARVNATDEVIAGVVQRRRTRRVFWLAGGLAATLVAVAVGAVVVVTRSPAPNRPPDHGTTIATRPEHLLLPGAIANLDPGGDIRWQASGDSIHVLQRRGSVTWRADNQLFLEVGAAVASIEATNATLRVETRMNLTDARVIGAAAVTSAAVALVTVSVYEGQAKLSSAGQTVVVQPGTTYQVLPGQPPAVQTDKTIKLVAGTPQPIQTLSADDELVVPIGESVTVHNAGAPIRIRVDTKCATNPAPVYVGGEQRAVGPGEYTYTFTCSGIDKHGRVRIVRDVTINGMYSPAEGEAWGDTIDVAGGLVPARAQVTIEGTLIATTPDNPWHTVVKAPASRSFVAVRIDGGVDEIDYYVRHRAAGDHTAPRPRKDRLASVSEFERQMKLAEPALTACRKTPAGGELLVTIDAAGKVTDASTTFRDQATDRCLRTELRKLAFELDGVAMKGTYPLGACNADDLLAAGTAAVARGDHAEAVKGFEAALRCKYDIHTLQLAFMASCRANQVDSARKYWKRMTPDMQEHLVQMCVHEHITKDMLNE